MTDSKIDLESMFKIKSGKKWEKYAVTQYNINKLNSYTRTEDNNTLHLNNDLYLPKFFHSSYFAPQNT